MGVLTECHVCIPTGVRVKSLEGIRSLETGVRIVSCCVGTGTLNLIPLQ